MRLEPTDEPAFGAVLPDVDAVAAGAFNERYDLARARKDLQNIVTSVEFFNDQKLPDVRLETSYRGSGLGGTRFLRTGEFPGTVDRHGAKKLWQRARSDVRQFVPGVECWADGQLFAWSKFRGSRLWRGRKSSAGRRRSASRACSCRSPRRFVRPCARYRAPPSVSKPHARGRPSRASGSTWSSGGIEVGLSTSFLVTQAQRDLLQTEVNLLQATLDHQSALVSFEALQQAPALDGSQPTDIEGLERHPSSGRSAPTGLFRARIRSWILIFEQESRRIGEFF